MKTPLEQMRELHAKTYGLAWLIGVLLGGVSIGGAIALNRWAWASWLALLTGGVALVQYVRFCTLAFKVWDHHLQMREDKAYHTQSIVDMNTEMTQRLLTGRRPIEQQDAARAFEQAAAHAGAVYAYGIPRTVGEAEAGMRPEARSH